MSDSGMPETIVERLRRWAVQVENDGTPSQVGPDADELRSLSAAIEQRDQIIAAMSDALDIAAHVIAVHCGIDTPAEWNHALDRVARLRALSEAASKAREGMQK